MGVDHVLHGFDAKSTDQLALQVRITGMEAECFHANATGLGGKAVAPERATDGAFLTRVVQARQPHVEAMGSVLLQEAADVRRPTHCYDGNALPRKITAQPRASDSTAT